MLSLCVRCLDYSTESKKKQASGTFPLLFRARRLELRQNKNYGSDPEYQAYVKRVPILLPLIPLYSVEKYKFLIA